ncbi:phage antirepressor KilAC domain-containing protein [Parageobacillus sp. VR-IP]|uniref:phage antirepressor KilAC domain-containing protein n=1 Tax=Parageobacillus sp. VR-IP TaxID=2742205 RepID=UPI0015824725|nr:phage antirepressor KilAC domain-containing protein [Parageobacillus sp. VR-IP]NUK29488.1 phage antirepressor KilAC domain-containing protein [Parageobacillus sp. VR-IP]
MNQLQIFNHPMFGELPVMIVEGVEWFGATEAAKSLSFTNPHVALKNHVEEDDLTVREVIDSLGRKQSKKFINESGLYSLIFGAAKQGNNLEIKEKAKRFKRWVTAEVLPTIRKTGGYVSNDEMFINTYLPFADEQTKMMFRGVLETVRKQNEQIAAMKPKAGYFDALVDRNLLTNFRDTAKELKVKERFFINWLLQNKFVYRDQKGKLKPYAPYVPELFELKEFARNGRADVQTLITPKGRETFRLLLQKERMAS